MTLTCAGLRRKSVRSWPLSPLAVLFILIVFSQPHNPLVTGPLPPSSRPRGSISLSWTLGSEDSTKVSFLGVLSTHRHAQCAAQLSSVQGSVHTTTPTLRLLRSCSQLTLGLAPYHRPSVLL